MWLEAEMDLEPKEIELSVRNTKQPTPHPWPIILPEPCNPKPAAKPDSTKKWTLPHRQALAQ